MIHKARDIAAEKFPGESHPFCTQKFVTDGREIFVQLHHETGQASLFEIGESQQVFAAIFKPFLKELEFGNGNILERWWARGREHQVALDPRRNFGQPMLFAEGIPTAILDRSVKAHSSFVEVARWYELSPEAIQRAVEFEQEFEV